jgi:hypothetical protein
MSFEAFQRSHFHQPQDEVGARALFKSSVSNVIVEITSRCNRVCTYCPVSTVDRKSKNIQLNAEIFSKLISDLKRIDYSESVCLNLYNEPMADREVLVSRIREIRANLPNARIYFSTNGDFLTVDYLRELVDAGLSELYVSIHAPAGKPYDDAYAITRFTELSRRIDKPIKIDTVRIGETIQGHARQFGIMINVFATNYYSLGSNRGESVSLEAHDFLRTSPCDRPFHDVTISYDGTLFPCCQMFVDSKQHKERYSVGSILDYDTIFEAYASEQMAGWRSSLLTFGPKESPCASCTEGCRTEAPDEVASRNAVYRELVGPLPPPEVEEAEAPPPRAGILRRLAGQLGIGV